MLTPFFVWNDRILQKVNPNDVICLYTKENYTKIYLTDKSHYMVRSTLTNALKKLPPDIFIKIHRSFAVSVHHIDKIDKDHLIVSGESLPIGKLYYQSLLDKLNIIE